MDQVRNYNVNTRLGNIKRKNLSKGNVFFLAASSLSLVSSVSAAEAVAAAAQSKALRQSYAKSNKALQSSKAGKSSYEVWGSDQSNSEAGQSSAGKYGSFLWVWDSTDIQEQLNGGADAKPLSCTPGAPEGPCNLLEIFPSTLEDSLSGAILGTLPGFGRLHGVLADKFNRYVAANIFVPTGGYVGVIDTETKEAIALFRVTATNANPNERSVHMSFWSADGSSIIIDNLHGKMIERIDVTRDEKGKITNLVFNKSAGVFLGKGFGKVADASVFTGNNAFGRPLIGSVAGNYDDAGKFICRCQLVHCFTIAITKTEQSLFVVSSTSLSTRVCKQTLAISPQ